MHILQLLEVMSFEYQLGQLVNCVVQILYIIELHLICFFYYLERGVKISNIIMCFFLYLSFMEFIEGN